MESSLIDNFSDQAREIRKGYKTGKISDRTLRLVTDLMVLVGEDGQGHVIKFGRCKIDPVRREFYKNGKRFHISPRLMGMLILFVSPPNCFVTRRQLFDAGWPRGTKSNVDGSVISAVCQLRKILGDRDLIETEYKKGYMLIVDPQ